MAAKEIRFSGITMRRESTGWKLVDIPEVDPRQDVDFTIKAVLWLVGIFLWIVGKVRGKTARDVMAASIVRDYVQRAEVAG